MATVERGATISASADAVWAVLADFGQINLWAPNVDHSCLMSDQAEGVGAVRRIQTNRMTLLETVEVFEPGRTLSYRITGLPPVIRSLTNTWHLDAAGASTEVLLVTEIDAGPRPPQQLIAKLVGRRLAGASEQMIAGLTAHLERAHGQRGANR